MGIVGEASEGKEATKILSVLYCQLLARQEQKSRHLRKAVSASLSSLFGDQSVTLYRGCKVCSEKNRKTEIPLSTLVISPLLFGKRK